MSGAKSLDDFDQVIVDRYLKGESGVRLAADLGVSRTYVNRVLKQAGIPKRRQPTIWSMSPEMRDQIIRAHDAGLSGSATAYLAGVDVALVYLVWRSESLQRQQTQRRAVRKGAPGRPPLPAMIGGRRVSPEVRDKWIETQYRDGLSMERIGTGVGLSRTWIGNILRSRGVPIRPPVKYQKLTEGQQEAAVARYAEGVSLEKVAAEFGVAPATIGECLKRHGQQPRTEKKWVRKLNPEQEADLVALYVSGEAIENLERRFQVNEGTILATVRRARERTRTPGKPGREVTSEQAVEITRRYKRGEPVRVIALDYQIARNRVIEIAVAGGAEPRKKRRAKGTVKRRGGRKDPNRQEWA